MGRGFPAGAGRRAHADRARQDAGRDRGGKTATVCGGDQGAPAPVPFLVPAPGRGRGEVTVPRGRSPGRPEDGTAEGERKGGWVTKQRRWTRCWICSTW